MNVSEAVIEYLRTEMIPHIAGGSELTAAILNGALRAGRKRIADKMSSNELVKSLGIIGNDGSADPQIIKDFADGAFEGREKISVSLAELVKAVTGIDSSSPLLADKISFTRQDADNFLKLLEK